VRVPLSANQDEQVATKNEETKITRRSRGAFWLSTTTNTGGNIGKWLTWRGIR